MRVVDEMPVLVTSAEALLLAKVMVRFTRFFNYRWVVNIKFKQLSGTDISVCILKN